MTKDQLLQKWPQGNIKSEPLPGCPKCRGGGRIYRPQAKQVTYCACVQISGPDDYRRIAVNGMINFRP